MMFWILIAAFVLIGAIGLTVAITTGDSSNFMGWFPNPIGCLVFAIAVLGVGGVCLFYLGIRAAS